jgi:hypothetical protein
MENITIAKRTVSTALKIVLRMALKLLAGTTQESPSHTVALSKQTVELLIAGLAARMAESTEAPVFFFCLCSQPSTVYLNHFKLLNPF